MNETRCERLHIRAALAVLFVALAWAGASWRGGDAVAATATARRGMVAAEHELASRAGAEMFAAGGNAVDAAVAAAFATGVVNPSSSGIGGGGFLLLYDPRSRGLSVLDFRECAPGRAQRDLFIRNGTVDPSLSLRGGLAVAVPGEIRGLAHALERFGRLPLATVMAPAIRYASDGFPVGRHLANAIRENLADVRAHSELRRMFLKPDGSPYEVGEPLRRPDLAATLRTIARDGPRPFYEGELGGKIVEAVAAAGGILSADDLRVYRVRERKAVSGTYRGLTIASVPPPSSGGAVIIQILNVLSGYDIRAAGPSTPLATHRIAEASKLAFEDRARWYGDPEFTDVPIARLLSASYAAELRERIDSSRTRAPKPAPQIPSDAGTSHLSAIDAEGWAASLTTTINTAFGSMIVVPGTGIILNNEMDDFSAAPGKPNVYGLVGTEANAIAPHKRPLSSMSPTLVLRSDEAILSIGGSGGPRIISATLQTITNVIDFGMGLDAAVAAPRVHHQWMPNLLFVEPALPEPTIAALRELGHTIHETEGLAAVQAVAVRGEDLVGVSDDRKGGVPAGW